MKEQAREVLYEIFGEWCDAIEVKDNALMKVYYNEFMGALEIYERLFNEYVYYRAKTRKLIYEEKGA